MGNHKRLFMQCVVPFAVSLFTITCQATATDSLGINNPSSPENINQAVAPTPSNNAISLAEKNYAQLQEILPVYQYALTHPWPTIPVSKRKLKIGMNNTLVPLLRERLKATHDLIENDNRTDAIFDAKLLEAIKNFQQRHGLQADGVVGAMTRQAFNVPAAVRVKQITVNMQRWAQLSPRLNGRFIMVNIPAFALSAYNNNEKVLSMKAIVGKPKSATPELESNIYRIVFNPYWNVPAKIAQNELVKKMQEDPSYLETNHMRILSSEEDNAREVDPNQVNWDSARVNGFPYRFRQDPGFDNSLGVVKFEFQNTHDVYLHDTPAKELFNQDQRALSHGCVRLENPFALVDYLMNGNPEWSEDRMQDLLVEDRPKYVKAYRPTPIIITYITAWVDENGLVNFRNDIYDKDN